MNELNIHAVTRVIAKQLLTLFTGGVVLARHCQTNSRAEAGSDRNRTPTEEAVTQCEKVNKEGWFTLIREHPLIAVNSGVKRAIVALELICDGADLVADHIWAPAMYFQDPIAPNCEVFEETYDRLGNGPLRNYLKQEGMTDYATKYADSAMASIWTAVVRNRGSVESLRAKKPILVLGGHALNQQMIALALIQGANEESFPERAEQWVLDITLKECDALFVKPGMAVAHWLA